MKQHPMYKRVRRILHSTMILHDDPWWKLGFMLLMTAIFISGYILGNYNVSLLSIIGMLLYNIWYFFGNIKERSLFFLMNFSLFLFLISRPLISMVRGNEWWYFKESSVWLAVLSIFIVLVVLNLGFCYALVIRRFLHRLLHKKNKLVAQKKKTQRHIDRGLMARICLALFLLGCVATMLQEVPKLLYAMRYGYTEIYSNYQDATPFVIRLFATMMPYFLCGYLACFPTKRKAFIPLALYIICGVPGFISGARSAMMVKIMFVFMYYCLRDFMAIGKDVWLGKIEKGLIVILLPLIIIGLGLFNYIREGDSYKKIDGNVVVNFFYLQGTSFDTVAEGFDHSAQLRDSKAVTSYTFGSFIDYLKYGTASQILFHAPSLGSGNSVKMATKSNSMAHHLSYLVLGKDYLYGHGRGSSFIIETYMDLGMLGVILYTLLLGIGLRMTPILLRKNWFIQVVTLVTLLTIFLIPRGAAMDMLSFVITIQFWIALAMMVVLYVICRLFRKRRNHHDKSMLRNNIYS